MWTFTTTSTSAASNSTIYSGLGRSASTVAGTAMPFLNYGYRPPTVVEETEAERTARLERERRAHQDRADAEAEAEARAKDLAALFLPREAFLELEQGRDAVVPSMLLSDVFYHVPLSRPGQRKVDVFRDRLRIGTLCFHTNGHQPAWDEALARYTLLASDERRVLQTAFLRPTGSDLREEIRAALNSVEVSER